MGIICSILGVGWLALIIVLATSTFLYDALPRRCPKCHNKSLRLIATLSPPSFGCYALMESDEFARCRACHRYFIREGGTQKFSEINSHRPIPRSPWWLPMPMAFGWACFLLCFFLFRPVMWLAVILFLAVVLVMAFIEYLITSQLWTKHVYAVIAYENAHGDKVENRLRAR